MHTKEKMIKCYFTFDDRSLKRCRGGGFRGGYDGGRTRGGRRAQILRRRVRNGLDRFGNRPKTLDLGVFFEFRLGKKSLLVLLYVVQKPRHIKSDELQASDA